MRWRASRFGRRSRKTHDETRQGTLVTRLDREGGWELIRTQNARARSSKTLGGDLSMFAVSWRAFAATAAVLPTACGGAGTVTAPGEQRRKRRRSSWGLWIPSQLN